MFQWTMATLVALRITDIPTEWLPSCNTLLFANVKSQMAPFGFVFVTEALAGTLYLVILYVNNKKKKTTLINQALHSLTVRYQLR